MKSDENKFWFPAKKYGYGWGPPNCWQGWVVIAVYVAMILAGALLFPPDKHPGLFAANLLSVTIALIFVCVIKGEKARWRSGGK